MLKIFIPAIKGKQKTIARGLWRNEAGRLFYDYLFIKDLKFNYNYEKINTLDYLKKQFKQEALFFIEKEKGFIYYSPEKIEVLNNKISITILKKDLKKHIKKLLQEFSGLTIYCNKNDYTLIAYYND